MSAAAEAANYLPIGPTLGRIRNNGNKLCSSASAAWNTFSCVGNVGNVGNVGSVGSVGGLAHLGVDMGW